MEGMIVTKSAAQVLKDKTVEFADLTFVDGPGMMQHHTVPRKSFDGATKKGLGIDGSSYRGFQEIHESDMVLVPDLETVVIDPFTKRKTISVMCSVAHPLSLKPYDRDPRTMAQRAEAFLRITGIADTSFWGPELEGFAFDSMRFDQDMHQAFYHIDSRAGIWNSGKEGANLAHRPRAREGYTPAAPLDVFQDFRSDAVATLMSIGIDVERHHGEVATGGQFEIDFKYGTLVTTGDRVLRYKYVLKNEARRNGLTVTFMPKPLFEVNGTGMHVHQSLWKGGKPLFYAKTGMPFHLSKTGRHYIGGLLTHAPALMGICAPTTNSYKRLVPGFEAPVNLVYSASNRSAAVRIPTYSESPGAIRPEFRPPDPSCNPYLAFAAMMLAGVDGIRRRTDPGNPLDKNTYELKPEELAKIRSLPGSLEESLDCLEKDHAFLTASGVFSEDFIANWIDYSRNKAKEVSRRPHPWEFMLWHDV